jgi:hypothetical protein
MLPPPKDKCQICACEHPPEEPHDAQSFFYQFHFSAQWNRPITWADAMAHCPKEVKERWTQRLTGLGIDINSPKLTGNIKSEQELKERLSQ